MDGGDGRQAPTPSMNTQAQSHEALKAMTDAADPGGAQAVADSWTKMASGFEESTDLFLKAMRDSETGWTGEAAEGMRMQLARIAKWSMETSAHYKAASEAIGAQSVAANSAKSSMPEPVPYDPAQMIRDAVASGNAIEMAALPFTMYAQKQKHDAAHDQAAEIVANRDAAFAAAAASVPVFAPPPLLTSGESPDGKIETQPGVGEPVRGRATSTDGPGPGGPPSAGGPGPNSEHGSSDQGAPGPPPNQPGPSPTPSPAVSGPGGATLGVTSPESFVPAPEVPSGMPSPGPGGGVPSPGLAGGPGGLPVGFAAGGGGFGPGGGPPGGMGVPGPGEAAGRGGGPGARGSGVLTGFGPGGSAAAEAAGRGAVAARGAAGMGGMPLAAGGRGPGGEDIEHKRPEYLIEPDAENMFGSDEMTAPPVIGEG